MDGGAFVFSLIFPMTGSNTRNTLSNYQKVLKNEDKAEVGTYSFLFHVDDQRTPSEVPNTEKVNVFVPAQFLRCLCSVGAVRR